jgi:hypothetical protein
MESLKNYPHVKDNGECFLCGKQLTIKMIDHVVIKTKGYAKYYEGGILEIKCAGCDEIQIVNLN